MAYGRERALTEPGCCRARAVPRPSMDSFAWSDGGHNHSPTPSMIYKPRLRLPGTDSRPSLCSIPFPSSPSSLDLRPTKSRLKFQLPEQPPKRYDALTRYFMTTVPNWDPTTWEPRLDDPCYYAPDTHTSSRMCGVAGSITTARSSHSTRSIFKRLLDKIRL